MKAKGGDFLYSCDFFTNVYDLYAAVSRCVDAVCAQCGSGLSYGQYVILLYIFYQKDRRAPQTQLERWSSVRKGTLSQHLRVLCELGYVEHRMMPQDHRRKEVVLTAKAERVIAQMEAELHSKLDRKINSTEQEQINVLLSRLQDSFSKQEAM